MKLHRIWGIFLRYFYNLIHTYDRLTDMFFWPFIDLLLWGLTSSYLVSTGSTSNTLVLALLGGIILWIFPWRGQYEITVSLLEDLWNRNLVNLFATPILFSEWVVSVMFIGIFKSIISFAFASVIALALYAANIYSLGIILLPWAGLLIMFGWVFGFFIASLIMRYGTKIQTLAWMSMAIVSPFAGVFYPISVLPPWAQTIAHFVPVSYVFEGMRSIISGQSAPLSALFWPLILCLIYLMLSLYFLYGSYNAILKRGLISVE